MQQNTINPSNIVSKGNVRSTVNKKEYKNLKESIKTLGIGQAITIYENKDKKGQYVVVDGHQRLKIAKELKFDSIPVNLITSPNGETEILQHSLNVQRVSMTMLDEIKMMQDLTKNRKSKAEISKYYGKSIPQIEQLIQIGNVHPKILKQIDWDNIEDGERDRLLDVLSGLCEYDQSLQFEALQGSNYEGDELEVWELDRIYGYLKKSVYPASEVDKLFTQKELNKYGEIYKGTMNMSLDLFNVSKDTSPEFFQHAFKCKYPEIFGVLRALIENHNENHAHVSFNNYHNEDKFKSISLTKILEYKDPIKTLNTYDGFNGDFLQPLFYKAPKVKEKEEKEEKSKERPKYYAQTKKFFFLLQPIVKDCISIIDPLVCGEEIPRTYKWLLEDSRTSRLAGNSYESTSVKEKTCKEIIDNLTKDWFSEVKNGVSMRKINQLFIRLEMNTIQKIVEDKYANDLTFRDDVLSCMNTTNLMALGASKGKKTDMVAWILDKNDSKFPFSDIYEAEDGWYDGMAINTIKK